MPCGSASATGTPECSLHVHIFLYHTSLCLKIYLSLYICLGWYLFLISSRYVLYPLIKKKSFFVSMFKNKKAKWKCLLNLLQLLLNYVIMYRESCWCSKKWCGRAIYVHLQLEILKIYLDILHKCSRTSTQSFPFFRASWHMLATCTQEYLSYLSPETNHLRCYCQ